MVGSVALDLPTGATVVCAFGVMLLGFWLCLVASDWIAGRVPSHAAGGAVVSKPRGGEPVTKESR
jgi:hypothetical protein